MKSEAGSASPFSRWLLGWIPLGIASAIVFHGAILSPEDIPLFLARLNDKSLHGTEYFLLFLFAANAFKRASQTWLSSHPLRGAFGYCLLMGAVTEFVQFFVPGRSADIFDWAMDGLGASTALGLVCLFSPASRLGEKA